MHLDFSLMLVILTLLTGSVWALDRWLWAPRRAHAGTASPGGSAAGENVPAWVDFARSFFPVILVVLVLRSFVVEPFRIPSGSMMPTLLHGDFILVSKFSYGLRLPVVGTELLELGAPSRGDVVVFRFPEDPSKDFIKRVVGLPGDQIVYYNKTLYVNGERVPTTRLGPYHGPDAEDLYQPVRYREVLGDQPHDILLTGRPPMRNGRYTVPEGHYFVMGDNRDNSDDSRRWGFVPEANLVGRAFLIWMNWDSDRMHPIWNRLGDTIE